MASIANDSQRWHQSHTLQIVHGYGIFILSCSVFQYHFSRNSRSYMRDIDVDATPGQVRGRHSDGVMSCSCLEDAVCPVHGMALHHLCACWTIRPLRFKVVPRKFAFQLMQTARPIAALVKKGFSATINQRPKHAAVPKRDTTLRDSIQHAAGIGELGL